MLGINRTKTVLQSILQSQRKNTHPVKLIRKHTKRMKSEEAQMFLQKYTLVLVASKQVLGVPAAHLMDLYLERFRSPPATHGFCPRDTSTA